MKCRWSCQTSDERLFTIGHSTRSIDEFTGILRSAGADFVVDVRTVPRSRTNPQYNFDVLGNGLLPLDIGYERINELGGLRGRSPSVPPEVNGFWENQSFHNYADYALSDQFERGLQHLTALARKRRVAIMCAEAVWWRCHRRIIADYLLLGGWSVAHLMGNGRSEPARITPAARERDGHLVYPAPDTQSLNRARPFDLGSEPASAAAEVAAPEES
ncbi:MAG TPA: DUF488 domain-containing protein [Sphingomicrobium sp.]|nr:DUF488 domain-containing protein [Sphingomicrobium sp.]